MYDIQQYATASGRVLLTEWLASLRDAGVRAQVALRLSRLAAGNFVHCKPVGEGVWELRIHVGPGYRVYYAIVEKDIVLLLCGGDKRKQPSNIRRAIEYLADYRKRKRKRKK